MKILALLILFAVALVGCKDEKKEWNYKYGYTNEDIIGTYSFSNVAKAFEDLEPSAYCNICEDAQIEITAASSWSVKFKINCPDEGYSQTFVGAPTKNPDDCMIRLSSGYQFTGGGKLRAYNVLASVYQNDLQQIRLSGFAATNTYNLVQVPGTDPPLYDTIADSGYNYYFDIIKN